MTAYPKMQLVQLVGVYGNGGYEVEVLRDGATIAVLTVGEADIRAVH